MKVQKDMTEETPLVNGGRFPKPGKLTPFLGFVAGTTVLSGLNYGYHIGALNTPKSVITNCTELGDEGTFELDLPPCFRIDDALWGTIVGMFAIGGLVGGLVAGWLADKAGRERALLFNNFLFILGSLLMGFAVSEVMLLVGRIVVGIASGITTVVLPMYLGEISPINYRGALGVLTQLSVTMGIMFAQVLGLVLSNVPGWRYLVGLPCLIAVVQSVFLPCTVHSPRWLVMRNQLDEAKGVLRKLRGQDADESDSEFDSIVESQSGNSESISILGLLTDKDLRKPLIVAFVLQVTQQLSGINAVFYYSTDIFNRSNPENADILTVSVGVLNVVLTILSVFLMDKAGRRILLIIGEVGMILTAGLFTVAFAYDIGWLSILCTYTYVSSFAVGLGPIPFLILAEIFPTYAVGTASSLAIPINWGCNYLVGQFFPLMSEGLGDYAFLPFAAVLFFALLFTLKYVPETKGKSLQQISEEFKSS